MKTIDSPLTICRWCHGALPRRLHIAAITPSVDVCQNCEELPSEYEIASVRALIPGNDARGIHWDMFMSGWNRKSRRLLDSAGCPIWLAEWRCGDVPASWGSVLYALADAVGIERGNIDILPHS